MTANEAQRSSAKTPSLLLSFSCPLLFVAIVAIGLTGCEQQSLDEQKYAYREYLYVTNGASNDVTVIDALNFKSIKTIPVGKNPAGVAANPKTNEIYVVNSESNNVA